MSSPFVYGNHQQLILTFKDVEEDQIVRDQNRVAVKKKIFGIIPYTKNVQQTTERVEKVTKSHLETFEVKHSHDHCYHLDEMTVTELLLLKQKVESDLDVYHSILNVEAYRCKIGECTKLVLENKMTSSEANQVNKAVHKENQHDVRLLDAIEKQIAKVLRK